MSLEFAFNDVDVTFVDDELANFKIIAGFHGFGAKQGAGCGDFLKGQIDRNRKSQGVICLDEHQLNQHHRPDRS